MSKIMKIIRIITVAPILAGVILCLLFIMKPTVIGSSIHFICGMIFLVVLPLLAYPLQKYIPTYKDKGREGQRTLAMYFAVGGYVLGCVTCAFFKAPTTMWLIYLEYMISGTLITIINKVLHKKASGHACGVTAPWIFAIYFQLPMYVLWSLVLLMVYIASVYTKRHTLPQLLMGSMVGIMVFFVLEVSLL